MKQRFLILCSFVLMGLIPHAVPAATQGSLAQPQELASSWLGTRYRFGGQSPETGFDCSGLVAHAFEHARGITLPRNAAAQSRVGVPVKRSALQPGDLVFFNTRNRPYSHVGIYLGDGRFIHAPRPGARVRIESAESGYWRARFNGARRVEHPGA